MNNVSCQVATIQSALDGIKRKLTKEEAAKIAVELNSLQEAINNLQSATCQS